MKKYPITMRAFKKSIRLIAGLLILKSLTNTQAQADPDLSMTTYPGLSLTGTVGRMYQIQYSSDLTGGDSWRALTHFDLKWNPHQWVDTTQSLGAGRRFYRAVLVDVPGNVTPSANMVFIPPGKFMLGSPATEAVRIDDEGPQTLVTLTRGFWMGRYEVTQGEYLDVMGTNPAFFNGVRDWPNPGTDYGTDLSRPVENLTWSQAVAYCAALTVRERQAGRLPADYSYRLPTEAEWEYACRAGTTTPFYFGEALRSGMANFNGTAEYPPCNGSPNACENPGGDYPARSTPVGRYAANPWGLYDMHGNVCEYCNDWYGPAYPGASVTDPRGPATGPAYVVRGGFLDTPAHFCRSAFRDWASPVWKHRTFGFRAVLARVP